MRPSPFSVRTDGPDLKENQVEKILWLLGICIILFPLSWNRSFYLDWVNNAWFVNYFGETLRREHDYPMFYDTASSSGNPSPVFYGYLLYPVVSLISIVIGADGALRFFAVLLTIYQGLIFYKVLKSFLGSKDSFLGAIITVSSVYQMTNLYNRSALNEYFAFQFLSVGLCALFVAFLTKGHRRALLTTGAIGIATIGLGAHPPTFYLSIVFVGPMLLVGVPCLVIQRTISTPSLYGCLVVLAAVVLSPWVYILLKFSNHIEISHIGSQTPGINYFPSSIDSIAAKIGIFDVDRRVDFSGMTNTSTPYLDAPLQIPLLFLFMYGLSRSWIYLSLSMRIAIMMMLMLCLCTAALCFPPSKSLLTDTDYVFQKKVLLGSSHIYDLIYRVQFAYRLTNIVSLQLLVMIGFISSGLQAPRASMKDRRSRTVEILYLLSIVCCLIKAHSIVDEYIYFPRAVANGEIARGSNLDFLTIVMPRPAYDREIHQVDSYPSTFFGAQDYSMTDDFAKAPDFFSRLAPLPLTFTSKDNSKLLQVHCTTECAIETNILPTELINLEVDGLRLRSDEVFKNDRGLTFSLPSGTHTIRYVPVGRALMLVRLTRWIAVIWLYASLVIFAVYLLPFRPSGIFGWLRSATEL